MPAAVRSGMEFKLGEGNSGLRIHGALPKGTNRKCVWKARSRVSFLLLGMDSTCAKSAGKLLESLVCFEVT